MPVGFRINPGEARTDLYGIGKGAAQVIDLSPLREQNALNQKEAFARQQQENSQQQERENEINKNIGALSTVAINPADRGVFAQKAKAIQDYTIKNIKALRSGDPTARMGFDNLYGDYMQQGEQSKNARQQAEAIGKQISENPDVYRNESKDYLRNFFHPNEDGSVHSSFDTNQIKKNYDTQQYIKQNIRPIAEDIANKGSSEFINPLTGLKSTYTKDNLTQDESDKLFHDTILSNHNAYEQGVYDLSKDPEAQKKFGTDVNAYLKDKYYPQFQINRNKISLSEAPSGESFSKGQINATHTLNSDKSGNLTVMNPTTDESATIQHDANGNIIGGTTTIKLTPEAKAESDRNRIYNNARDQQFAKATDEIEKAKQAALQELPTGSSNAVIRSVIDKYDALKPKQQSLGYKPVKSETQSLNADEAKQTVFNKFKLNAPEILKGKVPEHVNLQKIDNSKTVAPKEGDERPVQGGTAIFKNGKWQMK